MTTDLPSGFDDSFAHPNHLWVIEAWKRETQAVRILWVCGRKIHPGMNLSATSRVCHLVGSYLASQWQSWAMQSWYHRFQEWMAYTRKESKGFILSVYTKRLRSWRPYVSDHVGISINILRSHSWCLMHDAWNVSDRKYVFLVFLAYLEIAMLSYLQLPVRSVTEKSVSRRWRISVLGSNVLTSWFSDPLRYDEGKILGSILRRFVDGLESRCLVPILPVWFMNNLIHSPQSPAWLAWRYACRCKWQRISRSW